MTKSLKLTNRKTVFRNVSKSGTKKGRHLAASGLIMNIMSHHYDSYHMSHIYDTLTQFEHIGSAYMSNEDIDSDWLSNDDREEDS